MNKWMDDFTKSIILSEVLRRLDKYGVSPWTIEKNLCGVASAKTLYNYMNGETKPRAQVYAQNPYKDIDIDNDKDLDKDIDTCDFARFARDNENERFNYWRAQGRTEEQAKRAAELAVELGF